MTLDSQARSEAGRKASGEAPERTAADCVTLFARRGGKKVKATKTGAAKSKKNAVALRNRIALHAKEVDVSFDSITARRANAARTEAQTHRSAARSGSRSRRS